MVPPMRRRPIVLAGSVLAGLALSCSGNQPPPAAPEIPRPPPTAAPPAGLKGPDLLPAQVLAQVEDENSAPYFARRAEGALLLYPVKGRWLTRPLGADGA